MTQPPPAQVGMAIDEIDTPALILDLDAFERNLARMADMARERGIRLRPHAKTHKSTAIANRQVELGAVGVCCQKVSEAEILVDGGMRDVLVANEIVGRTKTLRLAALARRAHVTVCVDDAANIAELERAAARFGASLDVLVEMDVGASRCGVGAAAEVVALAAQVVAAPHLHFTGLQAYQGAAQHLRAYADRRAAIARAVSMVNEARDALSRAGIDCGTITGAGTGTFEFELASGVYNEIQVGSYVFMDRDYGLNLDAEGNPVRSFEHSLFVLATVMSRPSPGRAIVDAGLKSFSVDSGLPELTGYPNAAVTRLSDEHGRIDIDPPGAGLEIGTKVRIIPGHCDPTVNLHDWYVCIRGGVVEALWPVSARGAVF